MSTTNVNIVSYIGGSGTLEVTAGYLYGSVYNPNTDPIILEVGGVSIEIKGEMIYNLDYITKPYPNTRIIAGTNQINAVFHY